MTTNAVFVPEMMEASKQRALMGALERLLSDDAIETVWPAAFEAKKSGKPIPPGEVEVVVLPLDRIGAPAGASGAGVYIAYYSHATKTEPVWLASPPLVVKIGETKKLQKEKEGADGWPRLSSQEAERFARPFLLDQQDAEWAVLIAPFHSEFDVGEEGTRNIVKVHDLWRLLESKDELLDLDHERWEKIERCVGQALDAVQSAHRATRANPRREVHPYGSAYDWYLRSTTGAGRLCHIPRLIFGTAPTVAAFGKIWDNPVLLVEDLISGRKFTGHVGAIHGDLHPKNIVLNHEDAARIIDFGWAKSEAHIVQDYLLLDLNLRGTTLPSQIAEVDILALANFLNPAQEVATLPEPVRRRAGIIKDVIWKKAKARAVDDWETEYLIPLLLVGYGLLVHLDNARNQPALVATVLAAARAVRTHDKALAA
jgi:hypothetical protein